MIAKRFIPWLFATPPPVVRPAGTGAVVPTEEGRVLTVMASDRPYVAVTASDRPYLQVEVADRVHHTVTVNDGAHARVPHYVTPVPNGMYWPIVWTSDHDTVIRVWEQYLTMGANSVPLCIHDFAIDGVLASRTDNEYVDNFLHVQEDLCGVPIQMQASFGWHYYWEGEAHGPKIFRENAESMFADDHLEVYHTSVADEAGDGAGLKALVLANYADIETPANYFAATAFMHCPGYRGATYLAALAKLGEACKWYHPCAVHQDNEYFLSARYCDWRTEQVLWGTQSWGAPYPALDACSRCQTAAGYAANMDAMGLAISSKIKTYVPDAVICQYWVHAQSDYIARYGHPLWAHGATTGHLAGMYPLYNLSYDRDTPIGSRTLFYDLVARYDELIGVGPSYNLWYHDEAPSGSYPYFTQRMDALDASAGYVPEQAMYDICYHLATKGAKGFAIWPGYTGKDKDPVNYPPGSSSYPASQMADDAAALRLIPVMHRAFSDYNED